MKNEFNLRYSKQLILDNMGKEGQDKLQNSRVLVIGAGGLGSPVLYYLAAGGIGHIGIVDFDVVGISNLQRQILHFTNNIGQKKVDSAKEKLLQLNPHIEIKTYPFRINIDNIEEILNTYDVVIDGTDNVTARYLLTDCCYFLKIPVIEGAVTGFEGTLMTILPDKSPCYRCLYPNPPKDGILPSCTDSGILGPVAGVIGSLQAIEAMKVVLGIGTPHTGRVLAFNAMELHFEEIILDKNPNCPLCGPAPSVKELVEHHVTCKRKIT